MIFSDLSKEEIKQSLIESYNTFSYTDSIKNLSESELKAKLEEYGTVSAWEYHDYDGNGTDERLPWLQMKIIPINNQMFYLLLLWVL